jgi:hypothetical protein
MKASDCDALTWVKRKERRVLMASFTLSRSNDSAFPAW